MFVLFTIFTLNDFLTNSANQIHKKTKWYKYKVVYKKLNFLRNVKQKICALHCISTQRYKFEIFSNTTDTLYCIPVRISLFFLLSLLQTLRHVSFISYAALFFSLFAVSAAQTLLFQRVTIIPLNFLLIIFSHF